MMIYFVQETRNTYNYFLVNSVYQTLVIKVEHHLIYVIKMIFVPDASHCF